MRVQLWKPDRTSTWHCTITHPSGAERLVDTGEHDRQRAVVAARELQSAPSLASTYPTKNQTSSVHEALDRFAEYGLLDKPAATLSCYQQRGGHLVRLLGDLPLPLLHIDRVQEYISQRLDEGAARETVRKELTVLRQSLKLAAQRGLFPRDVASVFPKFEVTYTPRTRYLTPDQFEQLLGKLAPHRRRWVLVATYSGARLSEVERLDWQDLDFEACELRIRGSKTKGSFRKLAMHQRLIDELKPRRVAGAIVEHWKNVRRDLAQACDAAKVPRVTPNDLRRTFASWLVQARETNFVVSRLLGHSTTKMVDLVYGQLSAESLRIAINKLPGS